MGRNATHAIMAYFIMGRSENSRNRVFESTKDGIITKAFDESKMTDPSLIIYAPVRKAGEHVTVVTNGDQTDTIIAHLQEGKTFEDALQTRTFEPDAPNFTPRISGMASFKNGEFSYRLSILKSNDGDPKSTQRFFYDYASPLQMEGHFIHTYQQDGDPLPSFSGEPTRISLHGTIDQFTQRLWDALNPDNKISLFVRFVSLANEETITKILNKNQ